MLARFFHAWERRLAFATKDRVVRPFEWGTEWIRHRPARTLRTTFRWNDGSMQVMEDTPEFFPCPPTSDFAFAEALAALRAKGEAGTLTFPSALTTPHPENNVVTGRWFPAAGDERLTRAGESRAGPSSSCRSGIPMPGPHRPVARAGAIRRLGAASQPALP